jgi:hypothetical protein
VGSGPRNLIENIFHKLEKKQLQKLENIQCRAIRGALVYRSSTPTNVMLAEAEEIPMFCRVGRNYLFRCYTSSNHQMVQLLEELSILVDNAWRVENEQPPISEYYKEITPLDHLVQSGNCLLGFNYTYESIFYETRPSFVEERQAKDSEDHNEELKKIVHEKMRGSKYFVTDGSKMENKPFIGFTSIDINDGISWKLRIAKITFTFTAEALAIGETIEIIEKIDSEKNFIIFSDLESVLKSISNTSTMNSTLRLTLMLKDKRERLESRGKNPILLDPGALWS